MAVNIPKMAPVPAASLGGSRRGTWLTLRNLIIVMFLGGLWHGAGWTFVIWGLYHGLLLAIHSVASKTPVRLPPALGVAITFVAVVFGWVLFRSTDLSMSAHLFSAMFGMYGLESNLFDALGGSALATLGFLLGVVFCIPNVWQWRFRPSLPMSMAVAAIFVFCVLRFDAESPFLYFQF